MSIKQSGGVFGRNPTFNDVTIDGTLTFNGDIDINSDLKVDGNIETTGNVIIGTSGKGIDFSATAGTGTSELLDDYEEGTFTPVVADATSGGNTGTASTANGFYTKIGNMVYLSVTLLNVNTSGMTAGNAFYIRSLPFTSSTGNAGRAEGSIRSDSVTFAGSITPNMDINDSWVRLTDSASGVGDVYLTVAAINSGVTDLFFSIAYQSA
jgi:cytoskeletal protein CcmA (bactofilin family)